jgi:acylphosphatase
MTSLHFVVSGRVQGVGFRWWVRDRAHELGLGGFVRNCDDGTVEVHATGSDAALDALREALRAGPPTAHVTEVHEQPAEHPATPPFEIMR